MSEEKLKSFKTKYGIFLDPQQEAAAFSADRHVLLLAVPGSGKTTVMVARLGYLTHVLGVDPSSVLAITYSVAGTAEMRQRYIEKFGDDGIEIRTIHGFCLSVINEYCYRKSTKSFRMLSDDDGKESVVRRILSETGGYPSDSDVRDAVNAISFAVNAMLSDDEISKLDPLEGRDFSEIFNRYKIYKLENELMDFDDQLKFAYSILMKHPDICAYCAGKFRHVCVDEAQDTSLLQHRILHRIAEYSRNLFMVGDEDQSIYGFRAASPDELLKFGRTYPDARVYFIEKNYRSTGAIVDAARCFISHNTSRREKLMTTDNEIGEKIRITQLADIRDLPEYVKNVVAKNGNVAVLARLNDSLVPVIDCLSSSGFGFTLRGRDSLFFTHYIIGDIKNMLAFGDNPYDFDLFSKIYYKLSLGLSRKDLEKVRNRASGEKRNEACLDFISKSVFFSDRIRARCGAAARGFRKLPGASMPAALDIILSDCGYGSYLREHSNETTKITSLKALAFAHPSRTEFFERLGTLQKTVQNGASGGSAVLSTIHSAKGLEFDHVIMIDSRNGILPGLSQGGTDVLTGSDPAGQMEEDRRLFYVGITRARKILELITCKKIFGESAPGADFIDSVSTSLSSRGRIADREAHHEAISGLSAGTEISHMLYGKGVVTSFTDERHENAVVKFETIGEKKLSLPLCVKNNMITVLRKNEKK